MQAKYKGQSKNGLKHGHEYIVKFSKLPKQYVYDCKIIFDVTKQEEIDIVVQWSSEVSIRQYWELLDELELDNE